MKKSLAVFLPLLLGAAVQAQIIDIFTSDFAGTSPWNFGSPTDPNGQIGGNGQFEYAFGAGSNGNAYLVAPLDMAGATSAETGTLVVAGTLDLSSLTFGTSDFSGRNFLTLGTVSGNKNSFDGTGAIFNISIAGFNNPGEYLMAQNLAVRFWSGGNASSGNFVPTGPVGFTVTLEVTGDDTSGWVLSATTVLSNTTAGQITYTSQYTRTDEPFDGLQSINSLWVGLNPDDTPEADSPENAGGETFVLDDVSVTLVPEPSISALLAGAGVLALAIWRRRR